MPDDRFDDLTKLVSKTTSRRGLLKGAAAVALSGVVARVRGNGGGNAEARARIKMACARLGQPCATGTGTPGDHICCPNLTCGDAAVCCKPEGESCVGDGDCCADDVCRPNPTGLGNRCLPPGGVGADCVEDEDCMGGLACETTTGQCGEICGQEVCQPAQTCDPYTFTCLGCVVEGSDCESVEDCCDKLVCAPNEQLGAVLETYCVQCLENGAGCFDDRQCCSEVCVSGACGLNG